MFRKICHYAKDLLNAENLAQIDALKARYAFEKRKQIIER
jgi:hypothetical protein